jgi:hypothetical protein
VASIGDNDVAFAVTGSGDEADAYFSLVEMAFEARETPSEDVLQQ